MIKCAELVDSLVGKWGGKKKEKEQGYDSLRIQKIRGIMTEKMKLPLYNNEFEMPVEKPISTEVTVALKPGQGCSGICGNAYIHLWSGRGHGCWRQAAGRYQANGERVKRKGSTGSEKPGRK